MEWIFFIAFILFCGWLDKRANAKWMASLAQHIKETRGEQAHR